MESLHPIFASIGARISPLSGSDDVAGFFLAAAAIPPDAPHRAVTIAQWLGGGLANAASMLISTLDSIRGMPRVQKILAVLPPTENMELGTVCDDGKLGPASFGRPNQSDNIIRLLSCSAPLIASRGVVKNVRLFQEECSRCHAVHHHTKP